MRLVRACERGDAAAADDLIARGAVVADAVRRADGASAAHLACGLEDAATAQTILARLLNAHPGAPRAADASGRVPLFAAATRPALAELLLDAWPDAVGRADKHGGTPLHVSAGAGAAEATELLLKRGAAVDARGRGGRSALGHAARGGHAEVVSLLLRAGASPARVSGDSPLELALRYRHYPAAKLLVDAGAPLDYKVVELAARGPLRRLVSERQARDKEARLAQAASPPRAFDDFRHRILSVANW